MTASHKMWSKTLSLAIAVAVQVDSFEQKLPWTVLVIQDLLSSLAFH